MNKFVNDFTPTVKTYYKELKKCNPISKSNELDLIKKAKNNNITAKNKLLTANLKFVFNVAKAYRGRGVSIDDLISEGNLGLIKAIDKFDVNKDVKFISYAVWWIRQSIQEFLKKRETIDSVESMELDGDNNFTPSSIDEHDDTDVINPISNISTEESFSQLDNKQKSILNNMLLKLDKRAQYIIKSYYGFDADCMTLEEIGKKLNLSRERVRKIKEKNLRILRSELLLNEYFSDFF